MAHPRQLKFVELTSEFFNLNNVPNLKVLEIGSYIVNGTVRPYFSGSEYFGVDLMPGPGVDIVSNGEELNFPDENFDVAISCECFEHNPHWVNSFQSMYQKLKKGGVFIASTASRGRVEHGTKRTSPDVSPGTQSIEWNYYKNLTKKDFINNLKLDDLFSSYIFVYNGAAQDLYFVGLKLGGGSRAQDFDFADLESRLKKIDSLVAESKALRLAKCISRTPIWLVSFLPDKAYQNFAVPYATFLNKLRVRLDKLFGLRVS
jgi:SAM-dependent methyltransferase